MNYLFNLGLNDKDTKKQEVQTQDAIMSVMAICGDCTITPCMGCYTHDDGTRVVENSFKIECYDMSEQQAHEIADKLMRVFNQECVIMTPFETSSVFITQ